MEAIFIRQKEQGNETRQRILSSIIKFITENGYSPSIREIAEMSGIKSTSTIHHHLIILDDMGLIKVNEFQTRSIKVIGYKFVKE